MTAINIFALIILGLLLQTGGAYLVNAAVQLLEGGAAGSSAASAAGQYSDYMSTIRAMESMQIAHAIIVSPILEEIVFRLIFLRAGKMVMPFWAANLVQALLFGYYHTVTIQKVYGFVMGLIIGCVFYYCPLIYKKAHASEDDDKDDMLSRLVDIPNSLLGIMITIPLHMIINASGIFVMPLFPRYIAIALQLTIGTVCMLAAAGSVFTLYRQSK